MEKLAKVTQELGMVGFQYIVAKCKRKRFTKSKQQRKIKRNIK